MNSAGTSRRTAVSSSSPLRQPRVQKPERDIWGLGLSSDLLPDNPSSLFSSTSASSSSKNSLSPSRQASLLRRRPPNPDLNDRDHPLYRSTSKSPPIGSEDTEVLVLSDVSRPSLTRLTSDLERRAGSSRGGESEEGSRRGSMDRLRMSSGESVQGGEVEVLIHQVAANESLAGIALLYGIDLATLRKTNKLWPSDPVHLRTHLYVPLDACRWNKASETLIRGPGEGQVTLAPKNPRKGKERAEEGDAVGNLIDLGEEVSGKGHRRAASAAFPSLAGEVRAQEKGIQRSFSEITFQDDELDPWANEDTAISPFTEQTQPSWASERFETPTDQPSPDQLALNPQSRTLDIVRMPSSQLRFFPKQHRASDSTRSSFDSGSRSSLRPFTSTSQLPPQPPLSIQNDLNFSHEPQPPRKGSASKMGTVRLRPPSATPSNTTAGGLADKLSNFFFIPPPPPGGLSVPPPRQPVSGKSRLSLDSTRSSTRGSTASSPTRKPIDELEMFSRERRGSVETLKTSNGVGRRGSERRKLD